MLPAVLVLIAVPSLVSSLPHSYGTWLLRRIGAMERPMNPNQFPPLQRGPPVPVPDGWGIGPSLVLVKRRANLGPISRRYPTARDASMTEFEARQRASRRALAAAIASSLLNNSGAKDDGLPYNSFLEALSAQQYDNPPFKREFVEMGSGPGGGNTEDYVDVDARSAKQGKRLKSTAGGGNKGVLDYTYYD